MRGRGRDARGDLIPTDEDDALGRALHAGVFASAFDRFVVPPLLLSIAASLGVSVGEAAAILSAYLVASAAAQIPWGVFADRIGRRPALRIALAASAVGGVACALAPDLGTLLVARVLIGAVSGGVVGTSIVIVGDAVRFARRHHVMAQLLSSITLASAVAALVGGVLADTVGWRAAFLLPAAAMALLAVLPGSPAAARADATERGAGDRPQASLRAELRRLRSVWAEPWARVLVGVAVLDGMALQGVVAYLAPAVQEAGSSAAVAGAATATIGAASLAATVVLRRLVGRLSAPAIIVLGGTLLATGYALVAADRRPLTVVAAAVLIGCAFPFLHATIQTWASETVPWARATATAMFGTGLLAGAALSAAVLAPLAGADRYGALFAVAVGLAATVATVAAAGRRRFAASVTGRARA